MFLLMCSGYGEDALPNYRQSVLGLSVRHHEETSLQARAHTVLMEPYFRNEVLHVDIVKNYPSVAEGIKCLGSPGSRVSLPPSRP